MRRSGATILALLLAGGCSGNELVVDRNTGPTTIGRTVQVAPTSTHSSGDESERPVKASAARLGIPAGHLPEPGSCRVWLPGEAPGQQKDGAAGDCSWVATQVPPGGWLVWRPTRNHKEVVVREYGANAAMLRTLIFDVVTGELLHEDVRGE